MKFNSLKGLSTPVSEIGLGTWAIGGPYWTDNQSTGWGGIIDENEAIAAIRTALDHGVNHIDTADVYGYGRSERIIANALRGINREKLIIATKVGWVKTSAISVFSPENIRNQCETSLRNLHTDYIDIFYFHHCDFGPNDLYLNDALNAVLKLKEEGKIRCLGLSGYKESDLLRVAKKIQPTVIQSWADIEHDEFIRAGGKLANFMKANGVGFIPMMPFAQGRLLGKYSSKAPPKFEDGDNRIGNSAFSKDSLKRLEPRLSALKKRFGTTTRDLARVAIQFLLANPVVVSVIPGFRNISQVKEILSANDSPLSKEDMQFILKVFPRGEMDSHPWAD